MPRRDPQLIDLQVTAELAQIDPDVKRRVLKYAIRRVRMVADAGIPVANDEPDIMVADAMTDTLTGVVTWDRQYPFSYHLCSVIRTRTSNQIKRATRRVHVSLEAAADHDAVLTLESRHGGEFPGPDSLLESARVAHQLYGTIRKGSVQDAPLMALLDAYTTERSKPREVMELTGMTRAEFLNARRRLDRLLTRIPPELRCAALDAMRGAGPRAAGKTMRRRAFVIMQPERP